MKSFIKVLVEKNRHLERLVRLVLNTLRHLKAQGFRQTANLVGYKLSQRRQATQLRRELERLGVPTGWPELQRPNLNDFILQKNWSEQAGYRPKIIAVLPLSNRQLEAVQESVRSIQNQSYGHWTLEIIKGAACQSEIEEYLNSCAAGDARIKLTSGSDAASPIDKLNPVILEAKTDYCCLLSEGVKLSFDAFYRLMVALQTSPDSDVLYLDDVHIDRETGEVCHLRFKPDWSPELLLSYNYIGDFSLIRHTVLKQIEGFRTEFGVGMQWDLYLRLMEEGATFKRVPHLGTIQNRTGTQELQREFNCESSWQMKTVLTDHLTRQNLNADIKLCENGTFRLKWKLKDDALVSIIIPNKNSLNLISTLVRDLWEKTSYPNKEIVIVDNYSTDPAVHEFYCEQMAAGNLRVVPFHQNFNYSAACNRGAKAARGSYLLFLNNDMEVLDPDWIDELVGWASQPKIGVVGTKLLYPDGSIQHCGVVLGLHYVTHINHRASEVGWGHFGTPDSYRNYLAVTGACQMISRQVFEEVGGYDEDYQIAYSDIAMCLRAWKLGYRNLYTPHASLIHYEQYTRGDNTPLPDMERMAKELRVMNLVEDPYYHPMLSPMSFEPKPRVPGEPSPTSMLKHYINQHNPKPECLVPIPWFSDEDITELVSAWAVSFSYPCFNPQAIETSEQEASRFILAVLRSDESIRSKFSHALSEGVSGEFCNWLCDQGISRFHLPRSATHMIKQVFAKKPGDSIRQFYGFRADVRRAYPTGLLPTGQRSFLHWLLVTRGREHNFSDEQIWWFFLEANEDPAREIEYTFRITQEWQQTFPLGLTPFGIERFCDWLKERHHLAEQILNQFKELCQFPTWDDVRLGYKHQIEWRAAFPEAYRNPNQLADLLKWLGSNTGGVFHLEAINSSQSSHPELALNVLGHFCYASGLQQSINSIVSSLKSEGVAVALRDVPAQLGVDDPDRSKYLEFEPYDISLIHVQPVPNMEVPYFQTVYEMAGLKTRSDVYRIGYWYWELEQVPPTWIGASHTIDELWAPSRFIANAMSRSLDKRITLMPPGVSLGAIEPIDRQSLGVSEDEYLFLFMFDMKSMMERKNPLGLIQAFKNAFSHQDKAKLLIKVSSGYFNPSEWQRLQAAANESGVLIIDEVFTRARTYGLIQACDCYVSLHRSEGLGLTMAEAMLLSKPVIATAYSGNVDFMNSSCSLLVNYQLKHLGGSCPDYVYHIYGEDHEWAHADIGHAASLMRWAFNNQEEAKQLGLSGFEHARHVLSPETAGKRLVARLSEISNELSSATPHPKFHSQPVDSEHCESVLT